ncbi:phosphoribosylanthranilate isomerase [Winogradskyella eckloniae]|uniref:phosphoribosylanthranilate isomerase n=1 Tax=Winogradskyella eckloniae TaxID=1089306 RepID=UPI0015635D1E|nr:phosphoribosylanthranilate isomerase [Winogradskyella eckloniae]NRD21572.1 phosphoribosylanthranilate isomerase [Winogradskyella eckloniae]
MKYKDNIEAVANLQPDFLGFIFYDKSARNFDSIMPNISKSIKKVGVFVDEKLETVKETIEQYNLQAVQLHGHETPEYCAQISNVEVIKVFSIKDEFNFDVLQPYEEVCDYYLFDTKGKLPGGNGYTFNWNVLSHYPSTKPYFLSGGIGLNEIESVQSFLQRQESQYCYAIDINSKFEIEPGLKNIEELEKFKKAVSSKQ